MRVKMRHFFVPTSIIGRKIASKNEYNENIEKKSEFNQRY